MAREWQELAAGPPALNSQQRNAWNWGPDYKFSPFPQHWGLRFHYWLSSSLWENSLSPEVSSTTSLSRLGPMTDLQKCFWSLCWGPGKRVRVTRQVGAISGWGIICTRRSVCVTLICLGKFLRWCSSGWTLGCKMKWGKSVGRRGLWSEVCLSVEVCMFVHRCISFVMFYAWFCIYK